MFRYAQHVFGIFPESRSEDEGYLACARYDSSSLRSERQPTNAQETLAPKIHLPELAPWRSGWQPMSAAARNLPYTAYCQEMAAHVSLLLTACLGKAAQAGDDDCPDGPVPGY